MRLVAEAAPAVLLGPARVGVARRDLPGVALGRPDRGRDDRRVDQSAAADDQPPGIELPVDLRQHPLGQAEPGELLAEAPDRAVVGHALGQRDAGETAEGQPVVDRRFEPLVGQPVPLLEEQQLEVGHERVGPPALAAGVDPGHDRLDRRPIDRRVQLVEPGTLLAAALHQTVRQPELPQVTPRHRRSPMPFPALNQLLASRARVSVLSVS
jgi:hypothetical protein